jgi:hypothetical protein
MTQPTRSNAFNIEARVRTNSHYAKAVTSIPGYVEAVALRDKTKAMQQSVLFPQVEWPTAPTSVHADLDGYLTEYRNAWQEEQSRTRDAEALTTVLGACERAMQSAIDDPNALLSALADDLDELMEQLEDVVTRLNGATTPTEAINADTVDAWKELPAIRREYDSIRHAQTLVLLDDPDSAMNNRSDHLDDPLASDVILRNLDQLLPTWRDADTRFAMQGTPPDRRPWPSDDLEQLVWLINSSAEVWIPTSSQLARLHAERRDRANPMPDKAAPKPPRPNQQFGRVTPMGAI